MAHVPNILDVKTDLRRATMASFSKGEFDSSNTKIFLENAEKNLSKMSIKKSIYTQVVKRLNLAKDKSRPVEIRREDLLTASVLI